MGNALGCKPGQGGAEQPGRKERAGKKPDSSSVTDPALDGKAAADLQTAGPMPDDVKIIFVLGGPGSGKGTQCSKIVAKYGHTHLSAGDLLREEVASGSELGRQCEETMKEGGLVPQEVIIGLLRAAMLKTLPGSKAFLIDGFPRVLHQADMFEKLVKPPEMVLAFDCPQEVMEQRLLARGQTSGRSDDNADTIRKRFTTFREQSLPVIEHYTALGKCHNISAVNCPDAVFEAVQCAIEGKVFKVPTVPGDLHPETSIIFVLGGPGSGKGTQCSKIVAKYGHTHLSAGDLLREEVASGSELGRQCEETMKEGGLVPMEVIIGLLRNAMVKSGAKDFLVDGFPRIMYQAVAFERMIKPCRMVLAFDCPEEVMEQRLLARGQTSGRSDDNAATIRKRFATFRDQSLPVIQHYTALGKCHNISAVASPDEVFAAVCGAMEPAVSAALSVSGPTATAAAAGAAARSAPSLRTGSRPASGSKAAERAEADKMAGAPMPQLAFA